MRIWLVEDDNAQQKPIADALQDAWRKAEVRPFVCERAVYEELDSLTEIDVPAFVVCDVRLRWSDTSEHPEPARHRDYRVAGIRCCKRLIGHPLTRQTPVILYSVYNDLDLSEEMKGQPPNVKFLPKGRNPADLIGLAQELLEKFAPATPAKEAGSLSAETARGPA